MHEKGIPVMFFSFFFYTKDYRANTNRDYRSLVFNINQKMALKAFYCIKVTISAICYPLMKTIDREPLRTCLDKATNTLFYHNKAEELFSDRETQSYFD